MSGQGVSVPAVRGVLPWGDGGRNGFSAAGGYVWQDRERGRLHRRVTGITLEVAGRYGFALAGRGALAAWGLAGGPVDSVELATDAERGVRRAAALVIQALRQEGFAARENAALAELASHHPWLRDRLARWVLTGPGEGRVGLELAWAARSQGPVWVQGIGPVIHEQDAAGGLVAVLAAGPGRSREYADAAALLGRYRPELLIEFAQRLDAALTKGDFAGVGRGLDVMPDQAFAGCGLSREQVTALRARFTSWPRAADAARSGPAAQSPKGEQ